MGELADRRAQTASRIQQLRSRLAAAAKLAADKACVYMTGSFGRCEASSYSDLDLFILGKSNGGNKSLLSRLDGICIMADLIRTNRELKIPEFSGDGRYLVHYSAYDLVTTLGEPEDDVTNTFTARLLLLLESRALLEENVHREAVTAVIKAYWRDFEDHEADFMPAFLANDILRLWRAFCVNYEARTERMPALEKAKGKVGNYKLKHSRLLTCYSAILYLLSVHGQKGTVRPEDALSMIELTPTERLECLCAQPLPPDASNVLRKLLTQYERFLETNNVPENDLIAIFMKKRSSNRYMKAAYEFGDLMFQAMREIGRGSRFHRLLVV